MIFQDRVDAGRQLGEKLQQFKDVQNAIVIGLPRGGVPVAYEVAKALNAPLEVVVPRKVGMPGQPELAVGAVCEDGTVIFNDSLLRMAKLSPDDLQPIVEKEKQEAQRRLKEYRGGRPELDLKDKVVILVDDGIATGATMRAAIASAQAKGAQKIIVAVPVLPPDTLEALQDTVDEVIYLDAPAYFGAVGMFYRNFGQTQDDQVVALMEQASK